MKFYFTLLLLVLQTPILSAQCWQKVASKYNHVLAIRSDGTLWYWGGGRIAERSLSTPVQLNSDTTWTNIATGDGFVAAIKKNGTLWVRGENSYGQLGLGHTTGQNTLVQMGSDTNWQQVSCGADHIAALKTDGTLWIWGRNNNGQLGTGTGRINNPVPTQLGSDTDWEFLSAGRNHTLVKKTNHSLFLVGACYGTQVSQLRQTGPAGVWKTMAAGNAVDYGIRSDGTLWRWNHSNGAASGITQTGIANDWLKADNSHAYSTEAHGLFVKTDGTLWAMGANQFGQLGNGTTQASATVPVQIGSATHWKNVIAGNHTSFAQGGDSDWWGWGRNQLAQFGNGKNRNVPQPVVPENRWKSISMSQSSFNAHTLAIQTDGTLWSWGQNNDGQLGIGSAYTHQALPVQIGSDTSWRIVSNGFHFSLGIKSNGTLWGWGRNGTGQLGLGTSVPGPLVPMQIGSDTTWQTVSAGNDFALAIKTDGTLWGWGRNAEGQLGNTSTGSTFYVPTPVGTDSNWIAVSAGYQHTLALRSDSTLWSWGNNSYGQIGRSGNRLLPGQVGTERWKAIAGGGYHSMAIMADGTLWAWGRNNYRQLGDGTGTNRNTPTVISPSTHWHHIAAGFEHSVAIQADSSLWAWGNNGAGQTADPVSYPTFSPTTTSPLLIDSVHTWTSATAAFVHSAALTAEGTLFTWGDNFASEPQTNFPLLGYLQSVPLQLTACPSCEPDSITLNLKICSGDSLLFNGTYLHNPGIYTQTKVNAIGCDSTVTLHLSLLLPTTGIDVQTACGSYKWIDDNTYTASNYDATYIFPGGALNGCDSIVTLNLTILPAWVDTVYENTCENSYTWAVNGVTYFSEGIYTDTLHTIHNCDSILTLHLTFSPSWNDTVYENTCENSYTWPINGVTYFSEGIYTDTLHTIHNCDSILSLHLTFRSADVSVSVEGNTLTAHANNAGYQWLDCDNNYALILSGTGQTFTPTQNGNYAVQVIQNGCTDTSACIAVTLVGIEEKQLNGGFALYPNPTSGAITLLPKNVHDGFTLRLLSIHGQALETRQINGSQPVHLDIFAPAGLYFIEITARNGTRTTLKIIKE